MQDTYSYSIDNILFYQGVNIQEEFKDLGLEVEIVEMLPRDCFTSFLFIFKTQEDLNYYRLSGTAKEQAGISFRSLDQK